MYLLLSYQWHYFWAWAFQFAAAFGPSSFDYFVARNVVGITMISDRGEAYLVIGLPFLQLNLSLLHLNLTSATALCRRPLPLHMRRLRTILLPLPLLL